MDTRLLAGAIALALIGCSSGAPALTEAERSEIRAAMEASRAVLAQSDVTWREAIAARAMPPDDAAPCTALDFLRRTLEGNPQSWHGWRISGQVAGIGTAPYPLTVVEAGQAVPEHSAEANHFLAELKRVDEALVMEDRPASWDAAYLLRVATVGRPHSVEAYFETTLAVSANEVRKTGALREFEGGATVGRTWLYDHDNGRLVCGGEAGAGSSEIVHPEATSLQGDLFVNLIRAIPFGLREL